MLICPDCATNFDTWAQFRAHVNETRHWQRAKDGPYLEYHVSARAVDNRIIAVLERFYEALEMEQDIPPTQDYVFAIKPAWATVEGRERLITLIDAEFLSELQTNRGSWTGRGVTKHPQFFRLSEPMRLALAQELEKALRDDKQ